MSHTEWVVAIDWSGPDAIDAARLSADIANRLHAVAHGFGTPGLIDVRISVSARTGAEACEKAAALVAVLDLPEDWSLKGIELSDGHARNVP